MSVAIFPPVAVIGGARGSAQPAGLGTRGAQAPLRVTRPARGRGQRWAWAAPQQSRV